MAWKVMESAATGELRRFQLYSSVLGKGYFVVRGLARCNRCDAPASPSGQLHVYRGSDSDLLHESCGLQLGVLKEA